MILIPEAFKKNTRWPLTTFLFLENRPPAPSGDVTHAVKDGMLRLVTEQRVVTRSEQGFIALKLP